MKELKLPQVGKRYRHKNDFEDIVQVAIVEPRITLEDDSTWSVDEFLMYYEELPNQEGKND
jgi:hypothetical protein